MVDCPICSKPVQEAQINAHIDSGCKEFIEQETSTSSQTPAKQFSNFFQKPTPSRAQSIQDVHAQQAPSPAERNTSDLKAQVPQLPNTPVPSSVASKRSFDDALNEDVKTNGSMSVQSKRTKVNGLDRRAPLAERMRPRTLDDVCGQELVGPSGVLRGLIEQDRVPSMVLWGGPGTGM